MLSAPGMLAFARPEALALALAAIPVVLLYFLRMRFRRKPVGSTYLWKALLGATSGGDAMRRRSVFLLILQAAAIALAALAAAGPAIVSRRTLKPGTVYIIDVSASMAALDGDSGGTGAGVSRVEAAVAFARREIAALGADIPVMAFACAATARPLLAEPSLGARAAASLRSLGAGSEAFSEGACADAIAAWLSRSEGAWQACLLTDGGLDLGGSRLAAVFGGALRAVTVGSGGESVGVTGLRLEDAGSGMTRASFMLWNGWQGDRPAKLALARGKATLASAVLAAAPGWTRGSLLFRGLPDAGAYTLGLEKEPGDLRSAPGGLYRLSVSKRRPLSVLVVGRRDPFLEAALAYGGIAWSREPQFPASLGDHDILIAETAIAEASTIPPGTRRDILAFGDPPADAPLVSRGPASGPIVSAEPSHPLSRFISWEGARAEAARTYAPRAAGSGEALVLATVSGAPVLVAWERGGYHGLACGIDLARSDIGLKSAFPILLRNFFDWCVPRTDDQSALTLVVGEGAKRALPATFRPRGVDAARSGPTVVLTAREPGFFEWEDGAARGYIAANVPAGELDAAPRRLQVGSAGAGATLAASEQTRAAPLSGAFIILLAACLAAEWLAWKGMKA